MIEGTHPCALVSEHLYIWDPGSANKRPREPVGYLSRLMPRL